MVELLAVQFARDLPAATAAALLNVMPAAPHGMRVVAL